MSTDERKVQLGVAVDGSNARAGFHAVAQDAQEMARDVAASGQRAAKGVEAIGTGGQQSAQQLDRATRSIAASIQRATAVIEAGERGTAKYFETLASQRGANVDALRPYLAQLEQAHRAQQQAQGSLAGMGVSAAQTAAALRGVPAQMTDIVTSLQGGQAPLTVLLQQGGQLKDMFGGVAPAARALGGYVLGLVNPLTLAAAAAGTLALAYNQGANEGEAFRKQIILSGNAAGVTSDQLAGMARGISEAVGTQGKAAEVLAQLVSTGRVSREVLEGVGAAVVSFSQETGTSVKELVKDFEGLGKKPTESLLKLNEQYNFLTAATYQQITALEEQGRKEDAAALAQRSYADMLTERSAKVHDNLGTLERAWGGVAAAAKASWDAMLNVGREQTLDDRIAAAADKLRSMQAMRAFNTSVFGGVFGASPKTLPEQQQEAVLAKLQAQKVDAERQAASEAGTAAIQQAGIEATKALESQRKALATGAQKMQDELVQYRERIKAIAAADPASALIKPELVASDESAIREKYRDKDADRKAAAAAREQQRELAQYRNLVDDLAGKQDGFSAQFNEQVAILTKGWQKSGDSVEVYNRAFEQLLARQPFAIERAREQARAEKEWADAREKRFKANQDQYEREVQAAQRSAQSVAERVQAMRDEEAALDLARDANISLAEALERVRIARLNEAIANAMSSGDQEKIDALQAEIAARRELAQLEDGKTARDKAGDAYKDIMKSGVGTDLSAGFDKASASVGTFVQTFGKLIDAQGKYNLARSKQGLTSKELADLDVKHSRDQINSYAALAGAAKGFFGEKTAAYKALQAAEMGLRAVEAASAIASITESFTVGTAKAAVGVANQATQGDPYSAFPRMAAMAAIMASLGFVVGGISGGGDSGQTAADIQAGQGTGTVLGAATDKSESIANSLKYLQEVAQPQLAYTAQMTAYLRSIDAALSGVSVQILKTGGSLTGKGFAGTSSYNTSLAIDPGAAALYNATKNLPGLQGSIAGRVVQSFLGSTKTSLADSGLQFGASSLLDVLNNGLDAQQYQVINKTTKRFFGLSKSTSSYTQYAGLDGAITQQFNQIVSDIYNSVMAAGETLGDTEEDLKARLMGLTVDLGRISLKDLNGDQIQEQLTAVFGAFGDRMAAAANSSAAQFQQVGEGYYETLVRVASGFEQAGSLLRRLGVEVVNLSEVSNKQGDVATELVRQSLMAKEGLSGIADVLNGLSGDATELASTYKSLNDIRTSLKLLGLDGAAVGASLIDGAGGLSELSDAISAFESGFLSESEQISIKAGRMSLAFGQLGLALPTSGEAFTALVKGIDTSTAAGQTLLGSVLGLSSGFSDLLNAISDVGSGIESEIERIKGLSASTTTQSLSELQTSFAIKSAQARAGDQAAIDALPAISQALLKAAEAAAGSSLDVAMAQAQTLASLQATLAVISDPTSRVGAVPSYGGTSTSGSTSAGTSASTGGSASSATTVYESSNVVSAAVAALQTSSQAGNAELIAEVKALRQSLDELRADQGSQALGLALLTGRVATVLERVSEDGQAFNVITVSP